MVMPTKELGDLVILPLCVYVQPDGTRLMYSEGKCTAHLTKLCCVSHFQGSVGGLAKGEVGASPSLSWVLRMHFFFLSL